MMDVLFQQWNMEKGGSRMGLAAIADVTGQEGPGSVIWASGGALGTPTCEKSRVREV